jgi:hypothetical protein
VTKHDRRHAFLAFSAEVTGFTAFELEGTGQAGAYLKTCDLVVGADVVEELLAAYGRVRAEAERDGSPAQSPMRREILSDEKLGAVARNIIKLWYIGTWYELPPAWTEAFGAREKNFTFMVSPTAYTEGLLWPAIGANPTGAKAPGFGSWAAPPRIPEIAEVSTGDPHL